jgi:O-acetyl-ADP-ribose deacetylase (regulator of RNase III)
MKVIEGDLIELAKAGKFDLIVHGCNCFCTMGAGIAKGIMLTFPEAYKADKETEKGKKEKLGTCTFAEINGLVVVNAYTQFDYRGRGVKVNYEAVRSCMEWIKQNFPGKRIGIPKIGAGLAGGDWKRISLIIDEELSNEDVTLVEYKPLPFLQRISKDRTGEWLEKECVDLVAKGKLYLTPDITSNPLTASASNKKNEGFSQGFHFIFSGTACGTSKL